MHKTHHEMHKTAAFSLVERRVTDDCIREKAISPHPLGAGCKVQKLG